MKQIESFDNEFRIANARFHLDQLDNFERRTATVGPILGQRR